MKQTIVIGTPIDIEYQIITPIVINEISKATQRCHFWLGVGGGGGWG